MPKDPIKKALGKLKKLRAEGATDETLEQLRHMLSTEAGFVVANIAALLSEWYAADLARDLEAAFFRLDKNGFEDDPQCWGKLGVIKALHELAWQDGAVYLAACRCQQFEPVYGGQEDSAISVRIAATQALVQLPMVNTHTVLEALADLLADPSAKVRKEAARASVRCPADVVYPLLRLKIRLGDKDARVTGTCFDALLALMPTLESVNLVKTYTGANDVLQIEALASLASSSIDEAVESALEHYAHFTDKQLKRLLITALGSSQSQTALNFLFEKLGCAPPEEATWALEAVRHKLHDEDILLHVKTSLDQRHDDWHPDLDL